MNSFIIELDTELNLDNLRRRIGNDMIFFWLKIWRIKIKEIEEKYNE